MENMNEWMPQQSAHQVTTESLDQAVAKMRDLRQQYEAKKAEATEAHNLLEEAEQDLVNLLKAAGKSKYEAEGIGTASISVRYTYKVPSDAAKKTELFNYIKEKYGPEVLMTMVGIHSQTLNSFAKKELEADVTTTIPGLEAPTAAEILSFRKK